MYKMLLSMRKKQNDRMVPGAGEKADGAEFGVTAFSLTHRENSPMLAPRKIRSFPFTMDRKEKSR
jgi:hypothetical protein